MRDQGFNTSSDDSPIDENDDMESDDQVRAAPPPQRGREAAVPSPAGASLREDEVKIDVPKEVSTDAADPWSIMFCGVDSPSDNNRETNGPTG